MLAWLKDAIQPIRIHDPRFGPLRFFRDAQFWEGQAAFGPVGYVIEILVKGPATGPTEEQRVFYGAAQDRYRSLWPEIDRMLCEEAARVKGAKGAAFRLVCINLPADPGEGAVWELSYETEPSSWHFTVSLEGWVPRQILAEC